ncbi:diguanylate cyclase (GGDEF)-like protein [Fibrobacter sp. UWR4]|nr:diguanylate cyclase (GGDEF)-like protein [Fibrobacter sp. UWR4]PZW67361.1 diguanylate cyclase (GGDEF)-like protein [Fibrobacter sp. UWR1]
MVKKIKKHQNYTYIKNKMPKSVKDIQKLSFLTNTILLVLVILMMIVYYVIGATFLAYYSIFVAIVYLAHYLLIRKYQFIKATWSIYLQMTVYMAICTIHLGYDYGFQLYSLSTIPLIYYIKYMQTKFGGEDPKPNLCSIIIVLSCLLSSLYSVKNGPIYRIEGIPTLLFLGINITSVSFFLISFARVTTGMIIDSEKKLMKQADFDALTGLANRYYMTSHLEESTAPNVEHDSMWIAMIDVDYFKKINDTYGHAVGDQVLMILGNMMKKICKDCTISRWGGEEFLVSGDEKIVPPSIMETLLEQIRNRVVRSENETFHFTISVGISKYHPDLSIDAWIKDADKKLYEAKNNGRNQIVF